MAAALLLGPSGCASAPALPLDQTSDLAITETHDPRTGTREWQVQTRYAEAGPTMLLGLPSFAVDVIAIEVGERDTGARDGSGFLLRLHARDWGWRLRSNREVQLWLDGLERLELGEGEYEGGLHAERGVGNFHREVLVVPILREELARLAAARVVEVRAGEHRFRVHAATLEAVRRLLMSVCEPSTSCR